LRAPANAYGQLRSAGPTSSRRTIGETDHIAWQERPFAEALRALEEPAASDDQSQSIVRELSKYGTSTVLRVCLQLGDGLADCLCTQLYEDLLVRSRSSAL
jgi:hypothetical protein